MLHSTAKGGCSRSDDGGCTPPPPLAFALSSYRVLSEAGMALCLCVASAPSKEV